MGITSNNNAVRADTKERVIKSNTDFKTNNKLHAVFQKLDKVKDARRISQRRKSIEYGKNTAGYETYLQEVPKSKRRARCMKHPMTPDHTLEIPTKRWQGLVKAWRKALHHYDPPDLAKAMEAEAITENPTVTTVKDKELVTAQAEGLLVDLQPRSEEVLHQWEEARQKQQEEDDFDHVDLDDSDDDLL
mmetsp:Transcript_6559/g.10396  ORF Transcript_6559/g.10396 Transcript_6559/m.10396 type:complete len:189 (-) Transcript_6559:784-1350(-)|eukprot:CAMPEP_0194202454 /NCGR_PEP_ID=MMETSP0156-20130528/2465_1 /TAXON_ID=33649 /ORGANISM="Thalassionema nitzschioides, Strain L26-B" /LENGTH=188 /DNA_ID=CAMNT_0038927947 /DNA_START=139 /DNA_END=705 /DNA_ORIENTATION=+